MDSNAAQRSSPPVRPERRTSLILTLIGCAMFGFGFALVPMYSVICKLTGLNGKSGSLTSAQVVSPALSSQTASVNSDVNTDRAGGVNSPATADRWVTVQFVTTVNGGRNWEFGPERALVKVHPGDATTVYFQARNLVDAAAVVQAVPSVAPWLAATHLHKTECFCFNQQPFKAMEAKRMPVRFSIDPALPDDVDTVTLSYTLFEMATPAPVTQAVTQAAVASGGTAFN